MQLLDLFELFEEYVFQEETAHGLRIVWGAVGCMQRNDIPGDDFVTPYLHPVAV